MVVPNIALHRVLPFNRSERVLSRDGAEPPQAPLLVGLGRLLDGYVHSLLLCLHTPLKLLVDMVVGGLLVEKILNLLPELGIRRQHLVKVDSDLWGGYDSNDAGVLDCSILERVPGCCGC